MSLHFIATAFRFLFENNFRVPTVPLPGRPANPDPSPGGTVTWLGHSTLLIRVSGFSILTDPVLVRKITPVGPVRFKGTLTLPPDQLPPVDLVLISHDHYDHLNRATIQQIKDRAGCFAVPQGVGSHLRNWGVPPEKIRELAWWEGFDPLPGLSVTATPARHFSGRGLLDRNRADWASWVIETPGTRLFFSGDSGYFKGFSAIGQRFGPFDMTFLECGAYDPAWAEVHMAPEQTVRAHQDLGGKILLPVHWATFNLALHPWYDPVQRLKKAADGQGISIATPAHGQTVPLPFSRNFQNPAPECPAPAHPVPERLGSDWWLPAMAQTQKAGPNSD